MHNFLMNCSLLLQKGLREQMRDKAKAGDLKSVNGASAAQKVTEKKKRRWDQPAGGDEPSKKKSSWDQAETGGTPSHVRSWLLNHLNVLDSTVKTSNFGHKQLLECKSLGINL